jgi:hypothetical protein
LELRGIASVDLSSCPLFHSHLLELLPTSPRNARSFCSNLSGPGYRDLHSVVPSAHHTLGRYGSSSLRSERDLCQEEGVDVDSPAETARKGLLHGDVEL